MDDGPLEALYPTYSFLGVFLGVIQRILHDGVEQATLPRLKGEIGMWVDGEGREVTWGSIAQSAVFGAVSAALIVGVPAWYLVRFHSADISAWFWRLLG